MLNLPLFIQSSILTAMIIVISHFIVIPRVIPLHRDLIHNYTILPNISNCICIRDHPMHLHQFHLSCLYFPHGKHFFLPYAVNILTGNVGIITILNRLGHGVSYSQLEENDTALCLQKMAAATHLRCVLPSTMYECVFTMLAWDNIDRTEETLTGKGR